MSLSTLKKIEDLTDLSILYIFDRIPLPQMDLLGHVCQRWSSLLPVAYNRRRSLILIIASGFYKQSIKDRFNEYGAYQHDNPFNERVIKSPLEQNKINAQRNLILLEYSSLNEIDSNLLGSTLPNITNLEIIHHGLYFRADRELEAYNDTTQIITLMSHWSGKLKTLQYSQYGQWLVYSPALFDAFNAMPALKRLWLEVYFDIPSQVDLSVLTQLNQFYISSDCRSLPITFQQYAPVMNPELKIAIGNCIWEENAIDDYCKFNHQLAKKFVRCQLGHLEFKLMKRFYRKFTSLTHVGVNMVNVTLSQLCLGLSALTNLTRLIMLPCGKSGDVKPFSEEDQLPSIHLSHIFPAVQWVDAKNIYGRCVLCGIEYNHVLGVDYQACFQQLVQPFRTLPKLEEVLEYK